MATIEENLQTIANDVAEIKTNLGLASSSSLGDIVTKSESVIEPTGTIAITENGTVDVSQYASANVNVSGGGGLPTSIKKIASGFVAGNGYSEILVNHNFGEKPDYIMLWDTSGGDIAFVSYTTLGVAGGREMKKGLTSSKFGNGIEAYCSNASSGSVGTSYTTISDTSINFKCNTNRFFRPNRTYFWVAIVINEPTT